MHRQMLDWRPLDSARAHTQFRTQALCALVEVKADFLADGNICQFVIEFLLWTTGGAAVSSAPSSSPRLRSHLRSHLRSYSVARTARHPPDPARRGARVTAARDGGAPRARRRQRTTATTR